MISKGLFDAKYVSNGYWKFGFAITGINYLLKYIQKGKIYFKL